MEELPHLIWPYILTALGAIVSILIVILIKKLNTIDTLSIQFNTHLLEFTKIISNFVTFPDCSKVRSDCMQLNKTIIQAPLQKSLNEHEKRFEEQDQMDEQLWVAVRNHIHTEQGVIIKSGVQRV